MISFYYIALLCSFFYPGENWLSLTLVQVPTFGNHYCSKLQIGGNWRFDICWFLRLRLLMCYLSRSLCQWHAITNVWCLAFVISVSVSGCWVMAEPKGGRVGVQGKPKSLNNFQTDWSFSSTSDELMCQDLWVWRETYWKTRSKLEKQRPKARVSMCCFSLDEAPMGMTLAPTLLQFMENTLNSMTKKHHETYDSINKGCGAQITLISQAIINFIRMDCSTL